MSHPKEWARTSPDRVALIDSETGATMTYAELNARSNRIAHMLRARGLKRGDAIALMMVNELAVLPIAWAAQRSGLFFTPLSWRFKVGEAAYILENSGAKAVFVSPGQVGIAGEAADQADVALRFVTGDDMGGFRSLEAALANVPSTEIPDESPGRDMLYSSGTTGRPKGVRQELSDADLSTIPPAMAYLTKIYGFGEDTINLTPAPLYHAGPLRYSMCAAHMGSTNIIMPRFDAERMLQLIEQYRVTHIELVPTMLVRLMQLPDEVRAKYDISSVTKVIHGSGPCAPEVKRRAIEWFGPILFEQYGGTEGNGMCAIDSQEWLTHIGSVGKAVVGIIHVVDDDGRELPVGETGHVYFEGGPRFEYHLDPEKTAGAYSPEGWSTLGDIGRLDADGYLWLSDRKSHMIISGGVNIYPQEAENVLINHPDVLDVAIFGLPDPEFGEVAVAAVHARPEALARPGLEQRLIDYCKAEIASFKCPRVVILTDDLPRHETGKIYKRLLVERYGERTAR